MVELIIHLKKQIIWQLKSILGIRKGKWQKLLSSKLQKYLQMYICGYQ